MQNRYVGDTGDFGKYLLLKNLCMGGLCLGVNWCLVKNETHNNDGKHISYLQKESGPYFESDAELFHQLKKIIDSQKRDVFQVQQSEVLSPDTLYFSETIPFGTERFNWHDKSLQHLAKSDVVFYDPDNGLEISSCGKLHRKAVKYVYFDEIRDTYRDGKSIVIYQHTNRSKSADDQIRDRIDQLTYCLNIPDTDIRIVYSGQGTSRFYLIVKQLKHADTIEQNLTFIQNKKSPHILGIHA